MLCFAFTIWLFASTSEPNFDLVATSLTEIVLVIIHIYIYTNLLQPLVFRCIAAYPTVTEVAGAAEHNGGRVESCAGVFEMHEIACHHCNTCCHEHKPTWTTLGTPVVPRKLCESSLPNS